MKSFPGATSTELLHYIKSTLTNRSFDTAVIPVGVSDLLKNKNMHSQEKLVTNLGNVALKCRSFGITKLHISGVVVNNKMSDSLLESINTKTSEMCRESSCGFIGNRNIQRVYLYEDNLQLVEHGKSGLARNFIYNLDFLDTRQNTHTYYNTLSSLDRDLHVLLDLRLKHPRNFLFEYLNINSLRNKVFDLREIICNVQFEYFVIGETKLNHSFPSAQFQLADYEIRAKRDRDGNIIQKMVLYKYILTLALRELTKFL